MGGPPVGAGAGGGRDLWLDSLRAVALGRVILWHAFGAAAITYVLSAVPAMFFVTGSLLAKSLDRRPAPAVLADRARRLLVPLAAFSTVAVGAMAVARAAAPSPATALDWPGLVLWFLPVADPSGSAWEGGYLSSPLWYLRALLWLLALSPLLLRLFRRWPVAAVAAPAAAVVALDWVGRHPGWVAPGLVWPAGDVALYAVFLILGFAHRDGRLAGVRPAAWLGLAGAAAAGAAAWVLTQPVPALVVNNSHPMHLLAGLAWLGVVLAARPALAALGAGCRSGPVVAWVTRRTLTIYLWHPAALILTRLALRRAGALPPGLWSAALLAGTLAVLAVLVAAFGWVEDLAARRPARLWPVAAGDGAGVRRPGRGVRPARLLGAPAAAAVAAVVATASLVGGATPGIAGPRPPVPSQAPPRPTFAKAAAPAPGDPPPPGPAVFARVGGGVVWSPPTLAPAVPAEVARDLDGEIRRWGAAQGVPGAQVGIVRPRAGTWTGAFGTDPIAGTAVGRATAFDLTSATKSFTAALVFQLAEAGLVDLDAGLPSLAAAPELADHAAITPRQLLAHRSGLAGYRDTPEFAADPAAMDSAAEAVAAAARRPRSMVPGTRPEYSSTNYLVLGLLVEQVSGRSLDDLLAERLLRPLRLAATTQHPPGPGAPNSGTGGIWSTVGDLLRWGTAAYRDRAVTGHPEFPDMAQIDPASSMGPGTVAFCPCHRTAAGQPVWEWVGYTGSTSAVIYSAARDVVFVLRVTDDLWQTGRFESALELAARLADALPSAPGD